MNKLLVILLGTVALTFSACSNPNAKEDEGKEVKKVIKETMPELRNASEIAMRLKAVGAVYLPGIGNDTLKVHDYLQNKSQAALNLGIYFADLEYSLIYNSYEEAKLSASGIRILSNGLGINAKLDDALAKSFDEELTEEQRLLMLDEGLKNSRIQLREGESENAALLIVTGYFIEQFYQILQIINNYPDVDANKRAEMLKVLYLKVEEQDVSLENLIKQVNAMKSWAPKYKSFLNDLERLGLEIVNMKTEEELVPLNAEQVMNDETLINVRRKVLKLREFIIK